MKTREDLESFLIRMDVDYEELEPGRLIRYADRFAPTSTLTFRA